MLLIKYSLLIGLLASLVLVEGTLGPNDKKKKTTTKKPSSTVQSAQAAKQASSKSGPKPSSIADLIHKEIESTDEIVSNYLTPLSSPDTKQFDGQVLGYVTPWNSHGYDVSKQFGAKIDLNSPVWLQIKRIGQQKYELAGTHDIDSGWMKSVRAVSRPEAKIVPRILFEKLKMDDLHAIFNNEEEKQAIGKMLVAKAKQYGFDGYVFEIYLQLGGQGKTEINHLVVDLTETLHAAGKLLFLVIPPPLKNLNTEEESQAIFDHEDFETLKDLVDGFSLMTYDFATHNAMVAANAPIEWVEQNALYFIQDEPETIRSKLLLGLNFYGMKYNLVDSPGNKQGGSRLKSNPEPITGSQFIEWIKSTEQRGSSVVAKFDEASQEHYFIAPSSPTERVIVFYPSLFSIHQRIELAQKLHTGISIWELGQGLDYFYDLF